MSKSASIVEINGSRYDAATGQLVGAVKQAAGAIKPGSGKVMDGFIRRTSQAKPMVATRNKARSASSQGIKKTAQAVHRTAEHSQTLMRQIVSQPKLKSSAKANSSSPANRRSTAINSVRAFRAKTILKNSGVRRFGILKPRNDNQPVEVAQGEVIKATQPTVIKSSAIVKANPSLVANVSGAQLERMLDHALLRADAHKKAIKANVHGWRRIAKLPRWMITGVVLLVVLAGGSIFAWQRVPQVSLKFASSRAHIDASVPAYTPLGFSLVGPVKYDQGQVQSQLASKDDKSKTLTVTQQKSNLDSQSLAASSIPTDSPVQTSQVKGTTVYIYGKHNDATWVNKGIKYHIANNAHLSSDELLKIAGGL